MNNCPYFYVIRLKFNSRSFNFYTFCLQDIYTHYEPEVLRSRKITLLHEVCLNFKMINET